ncbi:MAG: molybdopterin-dependent oxidoreductase [Actinomycetota bacterium]|nr:molybdopterin-dependent oxidoreductase [Actinomycetota bacterium]
MTASADANMGSERGTGPLLGRTAAGAGLAGVLSGAVALGTAEVLRRLVPRPSLVLAVGEVVISKVPAGVADTAIAMFGRNDKTVLVIGITVVSLVLAAAVGIAARRRHWVAPVGFGLAAAAGIGAGISRSSAAPLATVLVGVGGAGAGVLCLRGLLNPRRRPAEAVDSRRRFLRVGAAAAGAGVVAAAAGRRLAQRVHLGTDPGDVRLASPAAPRPQPGRSATVDVPGVSPLFTSNRSFYRIDTALIVPRVDISAWRLGVTGMVARPFALSYRELSALPQIEADITISCVSNDVGGDLVGTARWQGILLTDLLQRARSRPGANQVVGRSLDGWTAGFPTALALDGRRAMVALGMNGNPLPLDHGFPARLVVPGLYGYVSATKWLHQIELTTFEAFDGYWVPRGWAKDGPIKITSRIDVPRPGASLRAGRLPVAGVAWAPHRGIARVEVSVDGGPWVDAALADAVGDDAWRQWRYQWDAGPGAHELRVRATDRAGQVQVGTHSPLKPSGATGYHIIRVRVHA